MKTVRDALALLGLLLITWVLLAIYIALTHTSLLMGK